MKSALAMDPGKIARGRNQRGQRLWRIVTLWSRSVHGGRLEKFVRLSLKEFEEALL